MRLAAEVRSRTRCARRRSRSRSSRSSSEGIQSAGTRSRRHNSASTRASTRSVLHASGAIPFTRRASATSTCQPAERSRSRTHTAPLIISTHAFTSVPSRRTSLASPSSSADVNPSALIAPPTDFAHHAALRYAQSIPTYSVTRALLSVSDCVSKRPLSRAPGRPSFMTFSPCGSGECGYWVAAGVGGEGLGEVGEERLFAEPAGDRGGEEPLDGAFASVGLAAEREFAVDDGAAEAALGMVVGRLDAVGVGEGPEGGPALEEVPGELAVVLGARALAGGVLEQGSQLGLEWRRLCLEPGPVAVGLVGIPGGEEVVCDHESCAAEVVLV